MNTSLLYELSIVAALGVLMVLLANPAMVWMPMLSELIIVAVLVVVFGMFAALYLREDAADEREVAMRANAGRIAFLAGASVVLLGIVFEFLTTYQPNPWLLTALFVMVAGKIVGNYYFNR